MTSLKGAKNSCTVIDAEICNISQYADAIASGGDPELEAEHIRESVVIIENAMLSITDYMEGIEKTIEELEKIKEVLELWKI